MGPDHGRNGINVVIVKKRNESRLRKDDVPVESILRPDLAGTAHLAHLATKKPATSTGRRRAQGLTGRWSSLLHDQADLVGYLHLGTLGHDLLA